MRLFLLVGPTVDEFWSAALTPVLDSPEIEIVGAYVDRTPPVPVLPRLWQELRKGRGGYVLLMILGRIARDARADGVPASAFLGERGIEVREIDDLYARERLEWIEAVRPDCIFRSGFGLIREPVLSLAAKGVLSYHHGDIRRYRGQPVAFWELYRGEREMAATVQVLSTQLDAGRIVLQRPVPIRPTDSWRTLERRAYRLSTDMLLEACLRVARPGFEPHVVAQSELGALHTLPNLRQWLRLQARVLRRRAKARRRRTARRAP